MLPRHLQTLGRSWIVRAEPPQPLHMSRNIFGSPWWTRPTPWAPYLPVNNWNPQVNWRSQHFFGPSTAPYRVPPFSPWNFPHLSWFHFSNFNMDSSGDEPLPKRFKGKEEEQMGRKPFPKGSNNPSKDARVPPLHGPPGFPLPSSNTVKVKGEIRRQWEDFSHYYTEKSKGENLQGRSPVTFDFTVMSYNILSQDLLEDNSHLYSHCRRPLLFWSYRLPNILKELEEMNADILCLQEVQEDHYRTQIKPCLESVGYHCEYKTRTGGKTDGCAICFKSSKFSLLSVRPVEYYRRNIALLDRDNIGLVLMLQPIAAKEAPAICVANTHLLYNPKRGDIKLTQLAILLAEIAGVAHLKDRGFCPIVLCGDFNSVPGSPLHHFIKEGMLNYEGLTIGKVSGQEQYPRGQRILSIPIWPKSLGITQNCVYDQKQNAEKTENIKESEKNADLVTPDKATLSSEKVGSSLQHHFCLSSVYSHFIPGTGVPEVTTCHSRSAITVDYIFYSPAKNDQFVQPGTDSSCNGLQLLGRLSLLAEQDLWSVNGLPNEKNSSDHLSLLAKFRLEI
ncbi:protein angel homolog 2 isoform 1-T2 [Rhinophrynus dorsalis]